MFARRRKPVFRPAIWCAGMLLGLATVSPAWADATRAEVTRIVFLESPNESLRASFWIEDGVPQFQLRRDGREVILPSPLGLDLAHADFTGGMRFGSSSGSAPVEDRYRLETGKQAEAVYRANTMTVRLENEADQPLAITFRLSDDGLAWRYEIPAAEGETVEVKAEGTAVAFHPDTRAWLQPKAEARTGWSEVNPSYEENYEQDIPVGTASPSPNGWVFPALFRRGEDWLVISETGMDGRWPGSNLAADSRGGMYGFRFPQPEEVISGGGLLPRSEGALHSPWRLLLVGDLATIVESTLGTDLAEPSRLPDIQATWIEPGIAAWSWGLLKDESVVYDVQKRFVDHAADLDWAYVLVDVNWDRNIGYERIAELADYAAGKGVKLLLWFNSSGDWNRTEYTPKNALLTRETRRTVFARLREMGIAGVKVDFFPGDGQSVMQRYLDLFEDAAEFGLLVNVHGSTLPRGMQRTWPNFLTSEAVKGFEFVTFTQDFADMEATHAAMLPFTRNLFDPMDYTPLTLGEIPGEVERRTGNGFQLALPVLFTSGIQHLVATPEQTDAMPVFVKEYLRELPARWDQSRFLAGYPGQYVVIARRAGERWYVAGISAGEAPRTVALDLSFIGDREGRLIRDGEVPREPTRADIDAAIGEITLAPGTGFVMMFDSESK